MLYDSNYSRTIVTMIWSEWLIIFYTIRMGFVILGSFTNEQNDILTTTP